MRAQHWFRLTGLAALALLLGLVALGALRPVPLAGLAIGYARGVHEPPAPPLAARDPGALQRAAVHYDLVCAACHASPVRPTQGDHLAYHPPAPKLHERIGAWPRELLFAVVRDGISHSAMPAWPAPRRSDEIWAMVGFLERLPGMDPAIYQSLAATGRTPPPEAPAAARTCLRCHAPGSRAGPLLATQDTAYLAEALTAFRSGARQSGYMQLIAAPLTDAQIAELAAYFAGLPATVPPPAAPAPALALHGDPVRKIAACTACHDPARRPRPLIPVLGGQHPAYLAAQLHHFADPERWRGGGRLAHLMERAATGLTAEEITALAAWYAGTTPPR